MRQAVKKITTDFLGEQSLASYTYYNGLELNPEKLENEIITVPFLDPKKVILIENLLANKNVSVVEKILKLISKEADHLRIVVTEPGKPDKRTATFKALQKIAKSQEFSPPQGLKGRIKKMVEHFGSQISDQAADLLAVMLPTDTLRLEQEVKKLSLLRLGEEITSQDISSMIVAEINPNIFRFIEDLALKNFKLALNALNQLIQSGLNENYILAMIVWQYRQILLVRDLLDEKQATASNSGINPYVFNKVLSIARNYDFPELVKIYQELEEVDFEIKTGKIEARPALELLVAKLTCC